MYQIGQTVLYGVHGACRITDVEWKTMNRNKIAYFVLQPIDHPTSCFYVPKDNTVAVSKLHTLLSSQELIGLLNHIKQAEETWISDDNLRKTRYQNLLSGADRCGLMVMVRMLYIHKKRQLELGKKFHQCDENFLRDAEKMLCSEISIVMNMSREDAVSYLREYVQ